MSETKSSEMPRAIVGISVLILFSILAGVLFIPTRSRDYRATPLFHTETMLQDLSTACKHYEVVFGKYPPEDAHQSSRTLHQWLGVTGPGRKRPFYRFTTDRLEGYPDDPAPSPPREILDTWQRPLRYLHPAPNPATRFQIRSRGEDGVWDTEDDLAWPVP